MLTAQKLLLEMGLTRMETSSFDLQDVKRGGEIVLRRQSHFPSSGRLRSGLNDGRLICCPTPILRIYQGPKHPDDLP
jgi:hypothetical protein